MTKLLLLYTEWTKHFGKKKFVCEVEAILSACTVKWVEEDKEEKMKVGGTGKQEEEEQEEKEDQNGNKKKEGKKLFFPILIVINKAN